MEEFTLAKQGQRNLNQDDLITFSTDNYYYAAVADGCGSYEGSELASSYTCKFLKEYALEFEKIGRNYKKDDVYNLLNQIANKVQEKLKESSLELACTTLAGVCVGKSHTIYFHIGDSRIYRINKKGEIWHTKDHTVSQELLDEKKIKKNSKEFEEQSHILTKAFPTANPLNPDVRIGRKLKKGEVLLLSTDGFWHELSNKKIKNIITSDNVGLKLREYGDYLEKNLLDEDNYTAIVLKN